MLKVVSFLLLFLPLVVNGAGIKKWVDDNGVTHYGDVPSVGIDAEPATLKTLSIGKGLSSKQIRLSEALDRRDEKVQKRKFKAEKRAAKKRSEQQKINEAYRKGKLIKGLTSKQVKRMFGEPDSIKRTKTKKGVSQKWRYEKAKTGRPEVIYIKNGIYSSHRNKKPKKR
jgi:hypothetical protein